jgi:hypothetical protein
MLGWRNNGSEETFNFHAFTTEWLSSSLFWAVLHRRLVCYRRFRNLIGPIIKGPDVKDIWTLEDWTNILSLHVANKTGYAAQQLKMAKTLEFKCFTPSRRAGTHAHTHINIRTRENNSNIVKKYEPSSNFSQNNHKIFVCFWHALTSRALFWTFHKLRFFIRIRSY